MWTIYLAGAITGKTPDEVFKYFDERSKLIKSLGFNVIHPMIGKGYFRNTTDAFAPSGYIQPMSSDHAIRNRDRWMVRQCDILFADLSESRDRVSIGTMFEIAWASDSGKQVILVLPDGNIHNHSMVLDSATIVFKDTSSAMAYLADLGR